jgi:FkbM family methyltransferase
MNLHELHRQFSTNEISKTTYIDLMHEKHQSLFDYQSYIRDTEIESISIDQNNIAVVLKNTGIRLLLDARDKRFIPIEILNFKATEAVERELILKLVSHCKVVVDVGANIGWYTINLGKLENVEKVFAFEPIPYTFEYLKKHVTLNGVSNAEIFNCGLSSEVGQREFFWTTEETGSSSMANIRERTAINVVKCELNTLDNFMKSRNVSVDFLKIDVEGAELFVLQGAKNSIERYKPVIFAELLRKWAGKFNYHPNDVIQLLESSGYSTFVASEGKLKRFGLVDEKTVDTNFFFLHADHHRQLINLYAVN